MNISIINGIRIEAISACVPKYKVDNHIFGKDLFAENIDNLIKAIGVYERHICINGSVTALDLSIYSAKNMLKELNYNPKEFGGIVFVTLTPDNWMPNNSTYVQDLLNFPREIACIDINHACSGYVYGLWIASLMAKNLNKKVLLLDGDTNSYYVSPYDKATALLFGDAGSATIVTPTEEDNNEIYFTFDTDGSNREVLIIPSGGFRNRFNEDSLKYTQYEDGSKRRPIDLSMNGQEVFNYVVSYVSKFLSQFILETNHDPNSIDFLIFHQANAFMLRQLTRKLGFSIDKLLISIDKYGNTSSVSIPLNISSEFKQYNNNTHKILMSGFGAGLSTCAAILNIGPYYCPGVLEYEQ